MKILTVCERGNVRSVTVASILKDFYGLQDVLAMGVGVTTDETRHMLTEWADYILIVGQSELMEVFKGHDNVYHLDVGYDSWLRPMHPDLVEYVLDELSELDFLPIRAAHDVMHYRIANQVNNA